MPHDIKHPWILAGYKLFATEGPTGLKIEVIARKVGKSKSSFYHHFADMEVFTEFLLVHHLRRSEEIAEQERACQKVDPDLIQVLLTAKTDLLFNRQLRINRSKPTFRDCLERSSQEVEGAMLEAWAADMGLTNKAFLAREMYDFVLEHFYLKLTEESFSYEWFSTYFQEVRSMVAAFKQ